MAEEQVKDEKKKKEPKGKKKKKNKVPSQRWKKYKIENGKIVRESTCPRCGPGIFLSKCKGRVFCGKCHYTEFSTEAKK